MANFLLGTAVIGLYELELESSFLYRDILAVSVLGRSWPAIIQSFCFLLQLVALAIAVVGAAEDSCALEIVSKCSRDVFFYAVKPMASTTPEEVAADCR